MKHGAWLNYQSRQLFRSNSEVVQLLDTYQFINGFWFLMNTEILEAL